MSVTLGINPILSLVIVVPVMALAPVLAPIAGGLLQTGFGWRVVFFALVAGRRFSRRNCRSSDDSMSAMSRRPFGAATRAISARTRSGRAKW